ncbi:MAG: hypothetical protein LBQ91_04700 [Oscillospiraceae bacterium]|jgi:hypothetical protein|nr:hypothetical protein [Oscillospiraceae bacterium]
MSREKFDETFGKVSEKAKELAGEAVVIAQDVYAKAESKTKQLAKDAKLSAAIAKDKTNLRTYYRELGQAVYHGEGDTEALKEKITATIAAISEKEAQKG